jgi:RNA polymerase sigma-70 factor (ECF subfamily)
MGQHAMPPTDYFRVLMKRLRQGHPDAAPEVFHRFARRLIALAAARLEERLGRKEDPEDVIQSVFRSFFRRQREGQFEFDSWDSLWGLLALITLRKCRNRAAYYHAERRDIDREVRLPAPGEGAEDAVAIDREPTPEEAATLTETMELVLRRLEPRDRDILACHLQGHSPEEIGARVGRARRTVRRTLERIRRALERVQAGEEFLGGEAGGA